MKKSIIRIGVTLLLLVIYKFISYKFDSITLGLLVFIIPILILVYNLINRKKLYSKKWFLSKFNIFSTQAQHEIKTDIPTDLLFTKLEEVIEKSEFYEFQKNELTQEILIGTKTNFWTWGENIYIKITVTSGESLINFTSVNLYGIDILNSNENHFKTFQDSFEQSLTI